MAGSSLVTLLVVFAALALLVAGPESALASARRRNKWRTNSANRRTFNVSIQATKDSFALDEPVLVTVEILNRNGNPEELPHWVFPGKAELQAPVFNVTKADGTQMTYVGRRVKRAPISDEEASRLGAQERTQQTIALSDYYDFPETSVYFITYNYHGLRSQTIQVTVEGRVKTVDDDLRISRVASQCASSLTCFRSCTSNQQTLLVQARQGALTYASGAANYLDGRISTRYSTWFGKYSTPNFNRVSRNFDRIRNNLDKSKITFDCGCSDNYYAYVYPSEYNNKVIYLCRSFWSAPTTGKDSKAGTIVHELSHFLNIGSTDDYVYGQAGCKNLAKKKPGQAVDNADSHEYFAENVPFLS